MICSFELSFSSGSFHCQATAETDRKVESATLMYRALVDLIANPTMFCQAFEITTVELQRALGIAPAQPELPTITVPGNEAIN